MRADFLNTFVDPESAQGAPSDAPGPASPDRFFNRELSWLAFNWRVLEEAGNPAVPLMERVRFLSISASNLDEFYMVRIAGLRGLIAQGVKEKSADGRSPAQQLAEAEADSRRLMVKQQALWLELRDELEIVGVEIVDGRSLGKADKAFLERYFLDQVFPVVTPIAIDPAQSVSIHSQ